MIKKNTKRTLDLFYMTPAKVSIKDLREVIDKDGKVVQIWEELNVLQIELLSDNTVDFESMKPEFKDPSDASFIKNRNVSTIYSVALDEDDFNDVKQYFHTILDKFGGFFCTDSDDFKPIYVVEDFI